MFCKAVEVPVKMIVGVYPNDIMAANLIKAYGRLHAGFRQGVPDEGRGKS